ncbi:hypothetical protein I0D68_07910 [Pseudomonas lalucatii]|nr:hypothetical protein I0D68_07910 [Pseudomonas lalucatii]
MPPGSAIDASTPDAWVFPKGTRLWKEFAYAGQPVETRFIERLADGSWRYLTYIWAADGRDAALAPGEGATLAVAAAPGGRYAVPSRDDCRGCHEAGPVPVLGFSALQLSPDRDGLAPHGQAVEADPVNLEGLLTRGLLRDLPRGCSTSRRASPHGRRPNGRPWAICTAIAAIAITRPDRWPCWS